MFIDRERRELRTPLGVQCSARRNVVHVHIHRRRLYDEYGTPKGVRSSRRSRSIKIALLRSDVTAVT